MKHAFFRTLPGRAIVIGLAVKIAVFALGLVVAPSSVVNAIDTVASVAIVLGAVYFVGRGIALANRRLLWKVRRKLIISYIFIGFIPSILIIAFFLLGGLFLFSNFSSYLVQNEIRGLEDRTTAIAAALALDIQRGGRADLRTTVSRRQAIVDSEIPGASMAVLPLSRPCGDSTRGPDDRTQASSSPNVTPVTTGPWDHVEPPRSLPEWLGDCGGFTGLIAYGSPSVGAGAETQQSRNIGTAGEIGLFASSVTFTNGTTPGYAVIVDIPIDDAFEHRMRSDTGVDLGTLRSMSPNVRPLEARNPPKLGAQGAAANGLPLTSITFFEERDWATGQTGSVIASMQLSIPDIYRRISAPASGGQSFSQSLLILLLVIGVLFLIIQGLALILGLVLARSITGSVHELLRGNRTRPPWRFHAQDRDSRAGPTGRAGAIVQLDDGQHRGSAPRAGGEEASRGRTSYRARNSDVAPAARVRCECLGCRSPPSACRRAKWVATITISFRSTRIGSGF